jgi:hypothetical protein
MERILAAVTAHPFPAILAVLDVAAAIWYGLDGQGWRVSYWLCAAGITVSATWGLK